MQLVIEVPDESPLVEQIKAWQDGASYELNVTQTGVGAFNLVDASEAVEEEPVEGGGSEYPAEDESNPAVKNLMASKRM